MHSRRWDGFESNGLMSSPLLFRRAHMGAMGSLLSMARGFSRGSVLSASSAASKLNPELVQLRQQGDSPRESAETIGCTKISVVLPTFPSVKTFDNHCTPNQESSSSICVP